MKTLLKNAFQIYLLCISFVLILTVVDSGNVNAKTITGYFDENTLPPFVAGIFSISDPATIYYEIHNLNAGDPLFLLHGGFADSSKWFNAKSKLSENYTVIAVDTRCHGKSEFVKGSLSYGTIANDLRALIWELGVERNGHPAYYDDGQPVNIVGWSDGGIAAINLCIKYPFIVNKAVFFGVNITPDGLVDPNPAPNSLNFLQGNRPNEEWIDFRTDMLNMWKADSYIEVLDDDPFDALQYIQSKTAVFAAKPTKESDNDNVVKISHMEKIAEHINIGKTPGSSDWCKYSELEGLAHGAPSRFFQANAFNTAVLNFLNE